MLQPSDQNIVDFVPQRVGAEKEQVPVIDFLSSKNKD